MFLKLYIVQSCLRTSRSMFRPNYNDFLKYDKHFYLLPFVTVTQPGANDVSVTRVNRITINTLPRSMAQVTKSINNSGDDVRQPEAEDISTEDIEVSNYYYCYD